MSNDELRAKVFEALDNAVANGYIENFEGKGKNIYEASVGIIVWSLETYDPYLSNVDQTKPIAPYIKEWQKMKKPAKSKIGKQIVSTMKEFTEDLESGVDIPKKYRVTKMKSYVPFKVVRLRDKNKNQKGRDQVWDLFCVEAKGNHELTRTGESHATALLNGNSDRNTSQALCDRLNEAWLKFWNS